MADDLSANLASLRIDRAAPKRRSGVPKFVIWIAVLAAIGGAAAVVWPKIESSIFKTTVEVTQIASMSPAQSIVELTATGYVQAERVSKVATKVSGRILAVHVSQGQRVEAGSPLLELDAADEEAAIQAAQSRVAAALAQAKGQEARVLAAEADLFEATQRAERERKLADKGVTATATAEDLEARVAALKETVKAAKASAQASTAEATAQSAQVQVLKTGLKNLTLFAPISGTVTSVVPQVGELVGPTAPGLTVADFSTLLVETDIPEGRLAQAKVGAPAEIVLDAYPTQRFRGRVKEITPRVDRAKATVMVKVAFADATEGVLPDMSARVSFLQKELDEKELATPPKIVVPSSALVERAGGKVVFVVEEERVRMVPVKLGPAFGSGYELVDGPRPGTQVVQTPPEALVDGQKVKLDG